MADVVGLISLAALVLLAAFRLPSLQIPASAWIFIYLIATAFALFVWHHHRAPKQPGKWLLYAFYSVIAALLWLGYSRLSSGLFFWNSEPTGSQVFDYAIALLISPGLTIVAVVGCLRAFVLTRAEQN